MTPGSRPVYLLFYKATKARNKGEIGARPIDGGGRIIA